MGPNGSAHVQKLRESRENLEKTRKNFENFENFYKNFFHGAVYCFALRLVVHFASLVTNGMLMLQI